MSEPQQSDEPESSKTPPPNTPTPEPVPPSTPLPSQPEPGPAPTGQAIAQVFDTVLAKVDSLSDIERVNYTTCETVISMGWHTFVDVGLAFAQIQKGLLYREEFDTFEAYCRAKWQYAPRYVYNLISAAQVFTGLCANCAQTKPDHESQIRPLIGLTAQETAAAWERAVEKAAGRRITARMVEAAVKNLELIPPAEESAKAEARQQRVERRQHAIEGMKELVRLIVQNAPHETLLAKAEALGPLLNLFSNKPESSK